MGDLPMGALVPHDEAALCDRDDVACRARGSLLLLESRPWTAWLTDDRVSIQPGAVHRRVKYPLGVATEDRGRIDDLASQIKEQPRGARALGAVAPVGQYPRVKARIF
jgi:hypothetical protein